MFNRYWRTYPWPLQLFLAFMTIFTLMSFVTYLILSLVPKLSGVPVASLFQLTPDAAVKTVRISLLTQGVNQLGTFLLPALLFASLTHPRVREYLGIRAPGKPAQWLLVIGIMLGLVPVLLWSEGWLMQHLHLGKGADEVQQQTDSLFRAYLHLPTDGDFLLLMTVLAILPAIGEELVFRGIFLRIFHRGLNRRIFERGPELMPAADSQRMMLMPVVGSALLFALWHSNPYGFVFIFIAGCVLALIYFLTGSLLCSMLAHFLYNGSQVLLVFFTQRNAKFHQLAEGQNLPVAFPLLGLILFAGCFYTLVKLQTPLPPAWSVDFRPDEV